MTAPLLELTAINKQFPGVRALADVDFTLLPGEIHALLGENGAGKSTLVKIISGIYQPDSGTFRVRGAAISELSPVKAKQLGIALVHQELSLVPALSVAENIFLGNLPRTAAGAIDWPRANREAKQAMAELGVKIDPTRELRSLSVAEQQLVEIAKTLQRQPDILLLDEPTSALSDAERSRLFEVIRALRDRGVGIIYISHHLSEIAMIADRVTVLRDGRNVGTIPIAEASQETIVRMMVGRALSDQFPKPAVARGAPALVVEGLTVDGRLRDISFTLHQGEILGVFGLMGAGQEHLARALFGLERSVAGRVFVNGEAASSSAYSPSRAIRAGLGLIARDRRQSLVPMLTVGPNISLPWLAHRSPWHKLELEREKAATLQFINELDIDPPLPHREVVYFSGGNQQKIVLARWMSTGSRILICDEPTRGIDVGAKAEVFALLGRLAERGTAILMISSEPKELAGMADRTLIMRNGAITGELSRQELSHEALLRAAS
jgi:ribose transport system ATP-binding protein